MIKEYIEAKYGFKVYTVYIAEVKRDFKINYCELGEKAFIWLEKLLPSRYNLSNYYSKW